MILSSVALLFLATLLVRADGPSPTALLDAGHYKRARALAEQRLKTNANDAEANFVMGRFKQAAGDLDGALPYAEKACQLDPKNGDYRYLLAGIYGQKAEKANLFSQPGLARRFKKEAETAVQLDPKNIDARLGLIEFHMQAPGIMGGDKAKARVLVDEVMKIDAARGYITQASIARREKKLDQIEGLYKKAVEANPKSSIALMTLANFYAADAQKKYDLTEKFAREAMKAEPDRLGPYGSLALLAALREQWAEIDVHLSQGEKVVPDNLVMYYRVGNLLLSTGKDLPRAERYFRKYLTQEPEPTSPTHAHAFWRLGLVLEKLGRKPEAILALETALRMKPDLDEAKKDLKRLR